MTGPIDADFVVYRLEEAGRTLLALPSSKLVPAQMGAAWPEFPQAAISAYGYTPEAVRPPVPSSQAISRMDEAYCWIALLPRDRVNVRRTLLMRSLVSPRTDRHHWSWRTIGLALGVSHEITRRWHAMGVDMVVQALAGRPVASAPAMRERV